MRWRQGVVSTVLLTAGTGCPHDHMRDGFIDRAARKDTREALEQECPPGKSWGRVCTKDAEGTEHCKQECI